jgi:hypothetical protein
MKKITLLLAIVAIVFTSCKDDATAKIKKENLEKAQQRSANRVDAPEITFAKAIHDFGTITEGDTVETTFEFTNSGKSELIITNIKGSCGCTVPTGWPKTPISPGETAEFTVKFNSKGKPNKQQKTVTVSSNTNKGKETVRIMAQVTPDPAQEKIRADRTKKRKEAQAKRKIEQERKAAEAAKNNKNGTPPSSGGK